jgi:CBS domain-containing protein
MKVADVMTHRVISVTVEVTVSQAARLMLEARISGLPVVDELGQLVGIISEGDLVRRAELGTATRRRGWLDLFVSPGKLAEEFQRSHGRKVSEIMKSEVHTVSEETPLIDAVELMESRRVKRLPVVRDGKPVGMLTRSNLMQAFLAQSTTGKTAYAADWAIRDQILAELREQRWAPLYGIDVIVRGGIAHLHGTILDDRQRGALIVAVENVPGVKKVHDHLAFIDPGSGMFVYQPDEAAESVSNP